MTSQQIAEIAYETLTAYMRRRGMPFYWWQELGEDDKSDVSDLVEWCQSHPCAKIDEFYRRARRRRDDPSSFEELPEETKIKSVILHGAIYACLAVDPPAKRVADTVRSERTHEGINAADDFDGCGAIR